MSIICRAEESRTLERLYTSKRAEFLAIYGRRRVGKTYLIRSFFNKKPCIFFSVMGSKQGAYKDQIDHFTQRIGEVFLGGIVPKAGQSWDETFKLLTHAMAKIQKNKKIILFLDELPWLATKRSKLLQTLDYYWNQYWSLDERIKLVVCGSSAAWVIDKIVNNKGGLHNRVTETMHLQPFNLFETEQYLIAHKVKLSRKQITEIYMITGGVPYYLSRVEPGFSASQVIERLAFKENAFLFSEFDNLFSSLFEGSEAYIEIIKTIASYREGLGQEALFQKLSSANKGSTGIRRLHALKDAGFIMSFTPHFHKKRGIYYRVIDEYTLFYLHWILPLRSTKIQYGLDAGYWSTVMQTPQWFSWAGYAFEAICYKHLKQIRRALHIPVTAIPNTWRFNALSESTKKLPGVQIDLLFDRPDDSITLCEIKYTIKPFVIDKQYAQILENKIKVFQSKTHTKKTIFFAIIAAAGVKENSYADHILNAVIGLDSLFDVR